MYSFFYVHIYFFFLNTKTLVCELKQKNLFFCLNFLENFIPFMFIKLPQLTFKLIFLVLLGFIIYYIKEYNNKPKYFIVFEGGNIPIPKKYNKIITRLLPAATVPPYNPFEKLFKSIYKLLYGDGTNEKPVMEFEHTWRDNIEPGVMDSFRDKLQGPIAPKRYIKLTMEQFQDNLQRGVWGKPNEPCKIGMFFDDSQGMNILNGAGKLIAKKARLLYYDMSRNLIIEIIQGPGFPGFPCLNPGYENAEVFEFVILRQMFKDENGKTTFGDHLPEFNFTNWKAYLDKLGSDLPDVASVRKKLANGYRDRFGGGDLTYYLRENSLPPNWEIKDLVEWSLTELILKGSLGTAEKYQILIHFFITDIKGVYHLVPSSMDMVLLSQILVN